MSVCVHICVCVSASVRACECLRLSLLSTICSQENDKRHGLSLTTSRVRSCWFGSGTFWLHTMIFQTSAYMSVCMSTCMCVCSGAYLHRCMYMLRTHTTHIHAHTTHTPHNNGFSTRLFFHQISHKVAPKHPNYSDESAPPSLIHIPFALFSFALYFCVCSNVFIRVCLVLLSWRAGRVSTGIRISSPVQNQYVMQGIGGRRTVVEDASCIGFM